MAKKSMVAKQQSKQKYKVREYNRFKRENENARTSNGRSSKKNAGYARRSIYMFN